MTTVYHPPAGLLALEPATFGALVDHARARTPHQAAWHALVRAGLVVDDRLDPPLRPIVTTLLGDGPRCRVVSRERGRLTVVDATVGGVDHAAIVVRPPGSSTLHLRHATAGTLARFLAGIVGLGAHASADPPSLPPLELGDWAVVRSGFETASPSGWVGGRERAELHEVRWAASPGARAATALVIARLDGGLAEIQPSTADDGAFAVTGAGAGSVWSRLCAVTSPHAARAALLRPDPAAAAAST